MADTTKTDTTKTDTTKTDTTKTDTTKTDTTKNLKRHRLGNRWNEMNYTDRADWLSQTQSGHTGWARESWWGLPNSVRADFVKDLEIRAAIYAWR